MNGGLSVDDKGVFYLYKNYQAVHIKLLIRQMSVLKPPIFTKVTAYTYIFCGFRSKL